MSSKQSQIAALVVLVAILIVVGLLLGGRQDRMPAPQNPEIIQDADTSGTPLSEANDTASIEQDFNSTDWTGLDADMDAQVSGQ